MAVQTENSAILENTENYARPGYQAPARHIVGPSTREVLELLASFERAIPRAESA